MIFYFDFISPYAYLAWTQIHSLAARHGHSVEPVPVLFAALLTAHGQKGPAEIPAKRAYVFKDVSRKARRLGVPPLVPPPAHPFNPLLALRAASFSKDPETRRLFIDALFRALWAQGKSIESEDAVAAVAERAGLSAKEVLTFARSDEAKAGLRRDTDQALGRGVFGVPTIVVEKELFFGTDSLDALEDYLQNGDSIPPELLDRWMTLCPSATRKI